MESTSVYWIPIFELLDERGFEVILVNARDAKHVPGRKTDVSNAQWLQRLHSYGLLRASFRPKGEIVELRAYLRHSHLIREFDFVTFYANWWALSRFPLEAKPSIVRIFLAHILINDG